ncbi:hypothetical protein [Sphingomonas sp. RS2018]
MLKLNQAALLLMVPAILGEAVQHAAEVHFGMYVPIVIADCIVVGFLAFAIGSILSTRLSRRT